MHNCESSYASDRRKSRSTASYRENMLLRMILIAQEKTQEKHRVFLGLLAFCQLELYRTHVRRRIQVDKI